MRWRCKTQCAASAMDAPLPVSSTTLRCGALCSLPLFFSSLSYHRRSIAHRPNPSAMAFLLDSSIKHPSHLLLHHSASFPTHSACSMAGNRHTTAGRHWSHTSSTLTDDHVLYSPHPRWPFPRQLPSVIGVKTPCSNLQGRHGHAHRLLTLGKAWRRPARATTMGNTRRRLVQRRLVWRRQPVRAKVLDGLRMEGTEIERGREGGRKEQKGEDKNMQGDICKYLPPPRQHVACHVGLGYLRGAFGTLDETPHRM